jgi:(2Fe-2S) ferredoxin
MNQPLQKKEKGLPKYSIKGGLCNAKHCLNICKVLCTVDGIWYCETHAKEVVKGFVDAYVSLGGTV